jgi:Tol biopolymer transport system component
VQPTRTGILAILILGFVNSISIAGVTTRITVDKNGHQLDRDSQGMLSANGKYFVFTSEATEIVQGDTNGAIDVFRKDLGTGEIVRVSVDSQGQQCNDDCTLSAISADGMVIAFESYATNLVPDDKNQLPDIFVHDVRTGSTQRVNVDSLGMESNGWGFEFALSADGGTVAFTSSASNLVPGDTNGLLDAFVHELATGKTTRVSVSSTGQEANGSSYGVAISGDGSVVAFGCDAASNLVPGVIGQQLYVHDRCTGETTVGSVNSSGIPGGAVADVRTCSVSDDGSRISFVAGSLVYDEGYDYDKNSTQIFVHDRVSGSTRLVSFDRDGRPFPFNPTAMPWNSRISGDGRFVVFRVTDLLAGLTDRIYVNEVSTGLSSLASVSSNGDVGPDQANYISISRDGRLCAFSSNSMNLVPDKTLHVSDGFLHQRAWVHLNGIPSTSSSVNFAIEAGEAHDLAIVLLSASGTSGFRIENGVRGLPPYASRNDFAKTFLTLERWIPLSFDGTTLAGLQVLPFFTARVDSGGRATTSTFRFPSVPSGTTFYASAITVDVLGAIESVTTPIRIVAQ